MAKILVAGGLCKEDSNAKLSNAREAFAVAVGREVVLRGHVLLGGCRTTMDAQVAQAAAEAAAARNLDPRKCIRSWVTTTTDPSHCVGEVIRSRMGDWRSVPRGLVFPEPVQEADVVLCRELGATCQQADCSRGCVWDGGYGDLSRRGCVLRSSVFQQDYRG